MKKTLILCLVLATVLVSCGDDKDKKDEKKVKTCKTENDVEVSCEDMKALIKLEEDFLEFHTGILVDIDYEGAIAENDALFATVEELMPAIERLMEKDPDLSESYFAIENLFYAKAETERYKQALADIEVLEISAAWDQDPLFEDEMATIVTFKNTSNSDIERVAGIITYYDAEGNVIDEGDIDFYAFHFEPEPEDDIMRPGYEGFADRGLGLEEDQEARIDSIDIKLNIIQYPREEE